jgi:hypothetical protein
MASTMAAARDVEPVCAQVGRLGFRIKVVKATRRKGLKFFVM